MSLDITFTLICYTVHDRDIVYIPILHNTDVTRYNITFLCYTVHDVTRDIVTFLCYKVHDVTRYIATFLC